MKYYELEIVKYLETVQKKDKRIQFLRFEKDELEIQIQSIGSPGTKVTIQTHSGSDQICNSIIRLEEKRIELAAAIEAYSDFRLQVTEQISRIESNKHAEILYRHYMQYQDFQKVAAGMNYNYSYILKMHQEAINKFRRVNPEVVEGLKKMREKARK